MASSLPDRVSTIVIGAVVYDCPANQFGSGSRPEITGMALLRLSLDVLADALGLAGEVGRSSGGQYSGTTPANTRLAHSKAP